MTHLSRNTDTVSTSLVYLVDDDDAVRHSLGLLLDMNGYRVNSHASAQSLLAAVDDGLPACIVADIRLIGASGLALAAELKRRGCELPMIFISGHADVATTVQAFKLGALDLLQKPVHEQSLLTAIESALAHDLEGKAQRAQKRDQLDRLNTLTARELEVLTGIGQGRTNRELAQQWGVSVRTVESHRAKVLEKLDACHTIELAPYVALLTAKRDALVKAL